GPLVADASRGDRVSGAAGTRPPAPSFSGGAGDGSYQRPPLRARLLAPLRGGEGRQARMAFLLLVPAALIVFGVVLYPAGRALVISFYDVDSPFPGTYPFKGLANYSDILGSSRFWNAVE